MIELNNPLLRMQESISINNNSNSDSTLRAE